MVFSFTACSGGKDEDPNLIKIGDYQAVYKGSEIVKDSDGNDALVATYDYTNNIFIFFQSIDTAGIIRSLIGTREHVGTANSYFSIYFTYFYIPYFSYKICTKIGFLVFLVFQTLKIQSFLEQVRSVGISSESRQTAFLCLNDGGEFLGSK